MVMMTIGMKTMKFLMRELVVSTPCSRHLILLKMSREQLFTVISTVDTVYTFAPAEGNKPMSLFLDKFSKELSYPNIFWGKSCPDDHEVKINYSNLVKSELRRSYRRVAECVDN